MSRRLIPYTGAPLRQDYYRGHDSIDVKKAEALRRGKLTWAKIGQVLAKDKGRTVPYYGQSVQQAVHRARRVRT